MCADAWMRSKVWSVVCPVRRHRWRGSRAWKSLLSLFGETNSHFISCSADHHTSVATHSVLSAATLRRVTSICTAQYGAEDLRKGTHTDLALAPPPSRRCVKCGTGLRRVCVKIKIVIAFAAPAMRLVNVFVLKCTHKAVPFAAFRFSGSIYEVGNARDFFFLQVLIFKKEKKKKSNLPKWQGKLE